MEEVDALASSHSSPLQIQSTIRVARNTASTNPSHRRRSGIRRCVEHNCTHNTTGLYCQGRLPREWLPSLAEATERSFLPCGTWSAPPLRSSLAAESDFHHSPSGAAETTLHSTQASACGTGPFNRSRARWVGLDRFILDFPVVANARSRDRRALFVADTGCEPS